MATISFSDLAPDQEVHFSLAGGEKGEFDLGPGGSYETDDPEVLGNARAHPWLAVEFPAAEPGESDEAPVEVHYPSTAIDAGLDQKVAEYEGDADEIAETLAADDEQPDVVVVEPDEDEPAPEPQPDAPARKE